MVADPASQPDVRADGATQQQQQCAFCGKGFETFLDRNVCGACGRIQTAAGQDSFHVFGFDRRFGIDRNELERRFYQISRALHPDRFTTAGSEQKRHSLERMSVVNEAYRTLRDPAALRQHLIDLEGAKLPEKSQAELPLELAESWFELQDALTESPATAHAKLETFETGLRTLQASGQAQLVAIEREIDQALDSGAEEGARRELFGKLARAEQAQNYLYSMERDIGRIRGKLSA